MNLISDSFLGFTIVKLKILERSTLAVLAGYSMTTLPEKKTVRKSQEKCDNNTIRNWRARIGVRRLF